MDDGLCSILATQLPKLPVPDLLKTTERYLKSIQAIVETNEYDETVRLVHEFVGSGGIGERLQQKLVEYAESEENWVYKLWLDDMYMKVRLPLPVYSSPGIVFPCQPFQDEDDQIQFAASFLSDILRCKSIVDNRQLPVDRARNREKGQLLCMEQYYRLFTSYRQVGAGKDSLISNKDQLRSQHIIVACKNQFFILDVVVNSIPSREDVLFQRLKECCSMADETLDDVAPVGLFTATDRDTWADIWAQLSEDESNRNNLRSIEQSIFILCLDGALNDDESRRDDVGVAQQMIHGCGSRHFSANRWFDKTLQFIIGRDGACGLCYEHAPAEGVVVIQMVEHFIEFVNKMHPRNRSTVYSRSGMSDFSEFKLRKLEWKIPADVESRLVGITRQVDRLGEDLDLHILRFSDYGKDFPKSQNVSPDSFVQLALQLTYYRIYGRLVSTYESASVRRFRLGRVDNIRSCSVEAHDWCKAMTSDVDIPDECDIVQCRMAGLKNALQRQTEILVQAISGEGIDNHMLGLREMSVKLGAEMPELFKNKCYQLANHFVLSTSQVPTNTDAFTCYGPVVPDGYGVCYKPQPGRIVFSISSFKSCETTNSLQFSTFLEKSLRDMKELYTSFAASSTQNSDLQLQLGGGSCGGLRLECVGGTVESASVS